MVVLVVVLLLTNMVTLGLLLARRFTPPPHPTPDERVADLLDRTARPPVVPGATRRVISIEILNTIELAGTRGRMAGLAGSLLPGLTRRFVYDEAVRTIRRQLTEERVVADVRVHQLRPPAGLLDKPPGHGRERDRQEAAEELG